MLKMRSNIILRNTIFDQNLKKYLIQPVCKILFLFNHSYNNDSFCIYFGIKVGMCFRISLRWSFHWINFNQKLFDAKDEILNIKSNSFLWEPVNVSRGSCLGHFSLSVLNFTKTLFYINIDKFLKQYLVPLILRLGLFLNIFLFSYVLSIGVFIKLPS